MPRCSIINILPVLLTKLSLLLSIFKVQLDVVPIKDSQNLHLTFPMPDLQKHYEAKVSVFLQHASVSTPSQSLCIEIQKSVCSSCAYGAQTLYNICMDILTSQAQFKLCYFVRIVDF